MSRRPLRRLSEAARDPQAARLRLAERLVDGAARLTGRTYVSLDYPPTADPVPRFGWDRPPHAGLSRVLEAGGSEYAGVLNQILALRAELVRIGRQPTATEPGWIQEPPWILGLDGASLYGFMRRHEPRRYVEVGSGNSTKFISRAQRDGGLATTITSIDPHPRAEIDRLCDRVLRVPLERAPLDVFSELTSGDIVFFDGSHRAFMNSDAVVFFLEVMPALAPGVIVGVHDIFLPWDYPPYWAHRLYSEQYLLAAHLLAGRPLVKPILPCYYVGLEPELSKILTPLWQSPELTGVDPRGFLFWMEKLS